MIQDALFTLQDIDAVTMAFPTNVSHLMPDYEKIPDEFKHNGTKWNKLFNKWFFGGLKVMPTFKTKQGVDKETAHKLLRQVHAVMFSFEPKHEHKEAACAYMLSAYFEDYTLL